MELPSELHDAAALTAEKEPSMGSDKEVRLAPQPTWTF